MKIATFSTLFSAVLLVSLWGAGISETDLLITATVMFFNAAFQVFTRGNEGWAKKPNYSKISKKIPVWVYSFISSVGLLSIVFVITKATFAINSETVWLADPSLGNR